MTQKASQKGAQKAPPSFNWTWVNWPAVRTLFAPSDGERPPTYLVGYGPADGTERLDAAASLRVIAEGVGAARVIDCRAQPGGARVREGWTQGLIKEALAGGPVYEWKGGDLGGKDRFRGRGCTPEGLAWLDAVTDREAVVLLCACAERHDCHLHRIVATDLQTPSKRTAMKLRADIMPRFVHIYLDGTIVGGGDMLEATDEGLPFPAVQLPALPEHESAADKWRATYSRAAER